MPSPKRSIGRLSLPGLMLAACLVPAPAAHPAPAVPYPPGSTPHFRHLDTEDGLASGNVQALLQDKVGYMWIATDNGLQRYDGYRFVTYLHDPHEPDSLAQNIVTALAFAPDGTLWAGTEGAGLDSLAPGEARFVHHTHAADRPGSLADDRVFALLFDHKGRLWVGTDRGVDRLDGGDFRHYATHSTLPNGERILSLLEDARGRLWVGSDHGVFWYDEQHDALVRLALKGEPALLARAQPVLDVAPISRLYADRAGRLWVGSEHGIGVVDARGVLTALHVMQPGQECALYSDHVRGMVQDGEGDLWIALLHGGLTRFDPKSGCFTSYRHDPTDPASLRDDDLHTLYQDRTGLYWIGGYYSGIDIYNPRTQVFGYYHSHPGSADGLAGDIVTSIYKQADGTLWVGSLKGLTRLDPTRRHYRQYILPGRPASTPDDKAVNAIHGDREGRLWFGTDYGIARYLPASDSFAFHPLAGAGGDPYQNSVNSILEDAQGRLWVGTESGLAQFDPAAGKVLRRFMPDSARADALPHGFAGGLCQSRDGALWVATPAGLARFDGVHDSFEVYSETGDARHGIASDSVLSCLATRDGRVWAGTDNGLDAIDPKGGVVRHYGRAEGLPDLSIDGMLERDGDLWLATGKGITRFSPDGTVRRNYAEPDGLQKGGFNEGAAYAAADGELFFGGGNGLTSFHPAALDGVSPAPDVAITRFTVLGKPQVPAAGETPQLRYRDNILGFEFAAFDYAQPARNRFRYTLEGFDEEWHSIAGERTVTYTNLDPGHYVLHVKGSNDGITWSGREATLAIDVLPPPWRSWWAYLGYVLAALVVGGGGFYLFARSLKRRQAYAEERNRRRWAEALHQLIQSVTALEDENAIAACLLDSLMKFIEYDRALFYVERDTGMTLIGCRGGDAVEQLYHERWPTAHAQVAAALRKDPLPRLLTDAEAATLEPAGQAPRHYLAVPLVSGNRPYRLLLVGRAAKTIQAQGLDIAAAMAKQVSVALDRALLIRDLERLATTDGLTRLAIRRSFLQRAEAEFDRSRRYQRELSVLMLDVDHFKRVNDSYGHETGDKVLRVLADSCRACLRQQDVIGRYGGEEFVAFLPETAADLALDAAERLRHAVETLTVDSPQGPVKITVSIGIATYNRATTSISALINAADRALYEAKQKGRNRVVVSS
ncbi:MAG TPA: two-component regulator propeller domain-containing protein [Gammaproteobacteria bacterium]|nr:two-component regulator propeller domain-containing protein [Gammaproteobacteria bacterium]